MKKNILLLLFCILIKSSIYAQIDRPYAIKGYVYDTSQEPLIGVTVQLKGTAIATTSQLDGSFYLKSDKLSENSTISFSMIGFKSQDLKAKNVSKIIMQDDNELLDEVVVTGYGNFKRASFTGSASVMNTNRLLDVPTTNFQQKLAGNVSGVTVSSTSSQPGSTPSIRIRGMGSMNAGNDPLYVIDGIPTQSGSTLMVDYSQSGSSILNTLNDTDIESMTIIKDAAAASLYGSRAANGVVVITTKKGESGKVKVNLIANWGWSNFAIDYRPTLNGNQRYDLLYLGLKNFGINNGMNTGEAITYADNEISKYASRKDSYTDWKDLLTQNGTRQQYEANISGGNDQTHFYSSLSYLKQDGILLNSGVERYTGRVSVSHQSNKFTFQGSTLISNSDQKLREEKDYKGNPIRAIYGPTTNPNYNPYDVNGNFTSEGSPQNFNPLSSAELNYNKVRLIRSFSNLSFGYQIRDGLKINERISYDFVNSKEKHWWDPNTEDGKGANGAMELATIDMRTITTQTQLTYNKTLQKSNIDALVAYETEQYDYNNHYSVGKGFPSSNLQEIENASTTTASSHKDGSRLLSYVGRVNYNYDNTYYLGSSFRRDGTSRLAPNNRWGNFWSVSGSYRISESTFWTSLKSVINDAQIRVSYGENGTLPNNLYGYMGLYKFGYKYNGVSGATETQEENLNLRWEKNSSTNIGASFTILNNLSFSVDFYTRNSKDLLYDIPVNQTTGFTTALMNIGALKNNGVEIEIKNTNIDSKDLHWETSLYISHNKNKLTKLDGRQTEIIESTALIHRVGEPYNSFYGYEYAGVDSQTGKELYYVNKTNKDRSTTTDVSSANKVILGSADPKVQGGLTNYLKWKDLDLNLTFTYSFGGKIYDNAAVQYLGSNGGTYNYIGQIPSYYRIEDMWQNVGDNAKLPQFVYGNSPVYSSRWMMSSNHVRIKNITLGYTFPKKWLRQIQMENIRIYASAQNLLTFKKKSTYLDPEGPANGLVSFEAPTSRTISFGINIGF